MWKLQGSSLIAILLVQHSHALVSTSSTILEGLPVLLARDITVPAASSKPAELERPLGQVGPANISRNDDVQLTASLLDVNELHASSHEEGGLPAVISEWRWRDILANISQVTNTTAPYPRQGGAGRTDINSCLLWITIGAVIVIVVGAILDCVYAKRVTESGRPRIWAVLTTLYSYGMNFPGHYEILFSAIIAVKLNGVYLKLTDPPITKSMKGSTESLHHYGAHTVGTAYFLIGSMDPILRLLALLVGEAFRFSSNKNMRLVARFCTRAAQTLSKWTMTNPFSFLLTLHFARTVSGIADEIFITAHLDKGYSLFSMYCILAILTSLAINPTEEPEDRSKGEDEEDAEYQTALGREDAERDGEVGDQRGEDELEGFQHDLSSADLCCLRPLILGFVVTAWIAFMLLPIFGRDAPLLTVKVSPRILVEPAGPVPASASAVLRKASFRQFLFDTTFQEFLNGLWRYGDNGGQVNATFGWFMVVVLALFMPALNMWLLLVAAVSLALMRLKAASLAMHAARYMSRLCMLDMFIFGVLLVYGMIKSFAQQGFTVEMGSGLQALICAELLYWLTYYLLDNIVPRRIPSERAVEEVRILTWLDHFAGA